VNESSQSESRRTKSRRLAGWVASSFRLGILLVLLGVLTIQAVAWLMPQDFAEQRSLYLRFASLSFFARVFQLHVGLGVAVLTLAAVLLRARWIAWVAAFMTFGLLLPYLREFMPRNPPPPGSETVRLMSINLYAQNRDGRAIIDAIREADPDVIVMCEVTPWSSQTIIHGALSEAYPYRIASFYDGGADVISRLPIRSMPSVVAPQDREARRPIVFGIGGTDVALYPVHLVSPGQRWLVGHNRWQVSTFEAISRNEKRPVLIVGDFNAPQLTANFMRLRQFGLRTTHELAGFGLGNTWGPKWYPMLNALPGVRIDHIFMSPPLTATLHRVGPSTGSDHLPVFADISIAKP
jgi:endonuclease/exonuclease/phosphatase (EEP) superfamily protein YafD